VASNLRGGGGGGIFCSYWLGGLTMGRRWFYTKYLTNPKLPKIFPSLIIYLTHHLPNVNARSVSPF